MSRFRIDVELHGGFPSREGLTKALLKRGEGLAWRLRVRARWCLRGREARRADGEGGVASRSPPSVRKSSQWRSDEAVSLVLEGSDVAFSSWKRQEPEAFCGYAATGLER